MKVNTTILGLVALTAVAVALPGPEAHKVSAHKHHQGHHITVCGLPYGGDFCLKRRDANNDNSTVGSPIGACGVPGEPCHKVKRAALAINDILRRHAENEPLCSQPGSYCERQRSRLDQIAEVALDGYDEVVKREAEAEADADAEIHLPQRDAEEEQTLDLVARCSEPRSFCAAKRNAEPEERHIQKRCLGCGSFLTCSQTTKDFCKTMQQQTWRKNHPNWNKNHPSYGKMDPQTGQVPEGKKGQHKHFYNFCGAPGTMCFRKRDAETESKTPWQHKHFYNFCGAPGTMCFRKRGAHPQDAAEADGFSETLYAIRDAVETIKREAEDERSISRPLDKRQHCDKSHCSPVTHAHLYAAQNNPDEADKAQALADGSDGPSFEIQPYFDDIEARVSEAIGSMDD